MVELITGIITKILPRIFLFFSFFFVVLLLEGDTYSLHFRNVLKISTYFLSSYF